MNDNCWAGILIGGKVRNSARDFDNNFIVRKFNNKIIAKSPEGTASRNGCNCIQDKVARSLPMRIAFDLDDTLIARTVAFPLEPVGINPLRWLFLQERLRLGTMQLCRQLRREGHEIWVYTSSLRSVWHIRKLFWLHGISLHGVVNQAVHDEIVLVRCSKHPPSFKIDLLVDDLPGIALLGQKYGFQVALVSPNDAQWVDLVWARVRRLHPA